MTAPDPARPPLWRVMHRAHMDVDPFNNTRGYAAELRAIADEIPEELYGAGGVKRWLLDEADKAEAGE